MSIRISSLGAIIMVVLMWSGGAAADTATEQTISGDSGSAAQVADSKAERKKQRDKKANKRVCTREKVTGSHMRKRVCRSQAEIDARREADQHLLNTIAPSGRSGPTGGR